MAGLTVTAPKGLRSSVSLGGGGGGSGNSTPFGRTPTFLRHLDEEEHKTVQQLVKGVVQVFNNSVAHDWVSPWSKSPPSSSSGTGFIISVKKRLIITNAHCTTDAMTLQVRKDGDFDKVEARVLATSHESDLSIITVDDSKFWESAIELPLGHTPRLQQAVDVIGFPKGGDGISVTSGVVSRVDWGVYTHGHSCNLVVTVDAAINSGNSGGPAVSDGLVVGVAFQSLTGGDNIGFIIPAAVLRSVLQDFEATSPSGAPLAGFGHLECDVSTLENPAKRKWLGLPEGASGVQVGKIKELSKLKGVLVEGDVLTKVDGHAISNDGRVQFGSGSPIDARVFITLKLVGQPLTLCLYRGGKALEVTTTTEARLDLVPDVWYKPHSSYVFFAGLVFLPMARGVTSTYYHTSIIYEGEGLKHVHAEQQVVALGSILPHSITLGYTRHEFTPEPLLKLGGVDILCLGDVLRATQVCSEEYIVFLFAKGAKLVLPLAAARAATAALMKAHGITAEASEDVVARAAKGPLV